MIRSLCYSVALHYFRVQKGHGLFTSTGPQVYYLDSRDKRQLSYYILETVPTLLIFSSSRSSPKSVGFRTCFSTIRSLSWISICRGGPYRHSLNWDGSIMPTNKQDQDIYFLIKIWRYDSMEYPCKVTTHVWHHLKVKMVLRFICTEKKRTRKRFYLSIPLLSGSDIAFVFTVAPI